MVRRFIRNVNQGESSEDFLKVLNLNYFRIRFFVLLQRSRIIALPLGATPIDFAFEVHTDIGMKCIGCRVNGVNSPLYTELVNGDEIEIITDEKSLPPMAWEKIAVTGKAKLAIEELTKKR